MAVEDIPGEPLRIVHDHGDAYNVNRKGTMKSRLQPIQEYHSLKQTIKPVRSTEYNTPDLQGSQLLWDLSVGLFVVPADRAKSRREVEMLGWAG